MLQTFQLCQMLTHGYLASPRRHERRRVALGHALLLCTLCWMACDSDPRSEHYLAGVWEAREVELVDAVGDTVGTRSIWLSMRNTDGDVAGRAYVCPLQVVGDQGCLEGEARAVEGRIEAEAYLAPSVAHPLRCESAFVEHQHGKTMHSLLDPPDVDHLDCTLLAVTFVMQQVENLPPFLTAGVD